MNKEYLHLISFLNSITEYNKEYSINSSCIEDIKKLNPNIECSRNGSHKIKFNFVLEGDNILKSYTICINNTYNDINYIKLRQLEINPEFIYTIQMCENINYNLMQYMKEINRLSEIIDNNKQKCLDITIIKPAEVYMQEVDANSVSNTPLKLTSEEVNSLNVDIKPNQEHNARVNSNWLINSDNSNLSSSNLCSSNLSSSNILTRSQLYIEGEIIMDRIKEKYENTYNEATIRKLNLDIKKRQKEINELKKDLQYLNNKKQKIEKYKP